MTWFWANEANITRESLVHIIQDTVARTVDEIKTVGLDDSYAEATKNNLPKRYNEKSVLIVKPKEKQTNKCTEQSVANFLKNIQVNKTIPIKDCGLALNFPSEEELMVANKELEKQNDCLLYTSDAADE